MPCVILPPEREKKGGALVRLAREYDGITVDQLARRLGITAKRLDEIERSAEVPRALIPKIVEAIGHFLPTFYEQTIPESGQAFMCGSVVGSVEPCVACGFLAEHLCDWPMGNGKTCDAALCEDHAMPAGRALLPPLDDIAARLDENAVTKRKRQTDAIEDLEFCPAHFAMSRR
jgi:DNA-binding XRE family transcriptional regulator